MPPVTLSAGVVVVRWHAGQAHYLLLRVFNYWDFPKGELQPGESILDAAVRETREETALDDLQFRWGQVYRETPPYGRGKVARYYLAEAPAGEVSLPINPSLGHAEHDEFRWLGYGQARALLGARLQPILDWAHALVEAAGPLSGPQ